MRSYLVFLTDVLTLIAAAPIGFIARENFAAWRNRFRGVRRFSPKLSRPLPRKPRFQKPKWDIVFEFAPEERRWLAKRPYWRLKRGADQTAALCLLVMLFPFFVLLAMAVGFSLGFPIVFWQERPGLGGRPFYIYKLRTMTPAQMAGGHGLSDTERVSRIGRFLRRTRLDEWPQLINIFRGDMSFIGPRPLLPQDQSDAYRARLLVRPGLTGWAQVIGGRKISPQDKAALDVWYICNAGLMLDLEIIARTIPMIVLGDKVSDRWITRAWSELEQTGILLKQPAAVS